VRAARQAREILASGAKISKLWNPPSQECNTYRGLNVSRWERVDVQRAMLNSSTHWVSRLVNPCSLVCAILPPFAGIELACTASASGWSKTLCNSALTQPHEDLGVTAIRLKA
jgi:hypothetical protein